MTEDISNFGAKKSTCVLFVCFGSRCCCFHLAVSSCCKQLFLLVTQCMYDVICINKNVYLSIYLTHTNNAI